MATEHCFTPVTITPVPNGAAVGAGGAALSYTVKTEPDKVDIADIADYTFVEYSFNPALDAVAAQRSADAAADAAAAAQRAASVRRIKFFKFAFDGSNPKYIMTHDAEYNDIDGVSVVIDIDPSDKKYLYMKNAARAAGGSKSSRKGRKSARKGRKSARKSRRSKGSRSKK